MGFAATHEPLRTAQVRCSPAHAPISDSSPSPLESQVATADPAPGHGILGGGDLCRHTYPGKPCSCLWAQPALSHNPLEPRELRAPPLLEFHQIS